ncbi:MAG: hypothetical protein ABIY55_02825 [Kofleriaceae bacterium]
MRTIAIALLLGVVASSAQAQPRRKRPPADTPEPKTAAQKDADRHFKSGVALFKEAKYTEALAEFERAYEIAPHPLVLYNIAGCHRELSHYGEAVTYYGRFLTDGNGVVPATRLTAAQAELDGILARVARVTVTITPAVEGSTLALDGAVLNHPAMPLILPPGEHKLVAHADGRRDADKTVRVASGDEVSLELELGEQPPPWVDKPVLGPQPIVHGEAPAPRFAITVGFGTNLRRASETDTGAPSVGIDVAIGSRLELGVDVVVPAYAVIPAVRVRLAGDQLSVHLVGALPIAITDGPMSETFIAGGAGLGLRYFATPRLAFRLESYVAFAGQPHGTTIPTFLRGELWF